MKTTKLHSLGNLKQYHFFFRPDFFNASAIIHCSCPLTERNSSAAHFSTASIVSASTRSRKVLFVLSFSFAIVMLSPLLTRDTGLRDTGQTHCLASRVSQSRVLSLNLNGSYNYLSIASPKVIEQMFSLEMYLS